MLAGRRDSRGASEAGQNEGPVVGGEMERRAEDGSRRACGSGGVF